MRRQDCRFRISYLLDLLFQVDVFWCEAYATLSSRHIHTSIIHLISPMKKKLQQIPAKLARETLVVSTVNAPQINRQLISTLIILLILVPSKLPLTLILSILRFPLCSKLPLNLNLIHTAFWICFGSKIPLNLAFILSLILMIMRILHCSKIRLNLILALSLIMFSHI